MADNDRPVETEIKLRIPPGSRGCLERHPAFQPPRASGPKVREEVTTYFDTPGLDLNRSSISLRVRDGGGRHVQTVKTSGEANGVATDGANGVAKRRGEWEWPVAGKRPDVGKAARVPAVAALNGADLSMLRPICTTRIDRTTWRLRLPDGTVAEAALDHGTIVAGERSEPVSELELELKAGEPGALYRLALDLARVAPMAIEPASKADRGFRLHTGDRPRAHEARAVAIPGDVPGAEAFGLAVGSVLGHVLANVDAADLAEPEGVHELRAAIRRMRSALVLFRPYLNPATVGEFNAELRRIGLVLGEARDWDVFALEILPAVAASTPSTDWLHLLRSAAQVKRETAYLAVAEELRGQRFTGLLLGMAGWVEEGTQVIALLGDDRLKRPIGTLRADLLDRMARTVMRRGRSVEGHSRERLHALRKATKKLRYGAEFLCGPEPHDAADGYIRACKRLAKRLGEANDAAMAPLLASRLSEGPELAPAIGLLAKWSDELGRKARHGLPKAWRKFRAAKPFW